MKLTFEILLLISMMAFAVFFAKYIGALILIIAFIRAVKKQFKRGEF